MRGLAQVLAACERADAQGRPGVLATVVRVAGSAYRRPGARMFLARDAEAVGIVSGGCLESDLLERAGEVLRSGRPRTVTYDMRSPDDLVWGLGLGCNGEIRVLLESLVPGNHPPYLHFLARCLRERRAGVVATVFDRGEASDVEIGARLVMGPAGPVDEVREAFPRALLSDARACLQHGRSEVRSYGEAARRVDVLIEHVAPAPRLLVFGAGSDAVPLVAAASGLGWEAMVLDHRPAYARPERFPDARRVEQVEFRRLDGALAPVDDRTAAVVMTHHFVHDLAILRYLLATPAPYIGLLGPRRRTENLLRELAKAGVEPDARGRGRIHGPVGVDIGSEAPEEIALAIAAEIQAVLSGRPAGFLRDREAPLHDWPRNGDA